MFGLLGNIVGPVAGLAGSWIEGKTAVQKAKATKDLKIATGEIDWDLEAMKATQNSWKDEWLTLLLSGPFILSFCGDWGREIAAAGFTALGEAPQWYSYSLGVVIAASFGIRSATKFFGGKKMITNYNTCLEIILEHEGGFVNHPKDPGGITNHGVTKKVYDKWVGRETTPKEMRDLTHEDVAPIYKKNYWNRAKCDQLPSGVDLCVFDWAVNSGVSRSAKALQRIVGVEQDGGIGPMTLRAVAEVEVDEIIEQMHYTRQSFYEKLSTFDTFGKGWTRRNDETKEKALEMAHG